MATFPLLQFIILLAAGITLVACSSKQPDADVHSQVVESSLNQSTQLQDEYEYGPFDTTELSGGYELISFRKPDPEIGAPLFVVELWKDTMIAEIASWSEGLLRHDVEDLGDVFLSFHRTRGPLNPAGCFLYEKNMGKRLLFGEFHDIDTVNGFLLCSISDWNVERIYGKGNMGLANLNTKEIELYDYPNDYGIGGWDNGSDWYYGPHLQSIRKDSFVIRYQAQSGKIRTQKYIRHKPR